MPVRASFDFSITSTLPATVAEVWAHARTMAGVNREFWPLARMTYPAHFGALDADTVVLGQRLFRSWILLFGLLPIDYDDLTLIAVMPEGGFVECSTMLTQKEWRHERRLSAVPEGCQITDSITFVPRWPVLGPLFRPVFALAFRWRHHNLRKLFAAPGTR